MSALRPLLLSLTSPAARPEITKNVEICMADILVQLIDECVSLPSDVLEILLSAFTSKAEVSARTACRLDAADAPPVVRKRTRPLIGSL
jgi:hypothetical protein